MDLEWGEHLSTGVTSLDEEHRNLIADYEHLVDALDHSEDVSGFGQAFSRLMASARDHFAHEERVMRNIGLADYGNHKQEHERLLKDAEDFFHNISRVFEKKDCEAVAKYFRFWLIRHIQDHDQKIKQHIDRAN